MSNDRQKRIEQRAYEIWEREGRRSGMDAENWQRAEAEIAQEEAEASTAELAEAEALTAKPAEPEPVAKPAEPEPAAKAKPAAKPRARPEVKPTEPVAGAQVRKSSSKSKVSEEEIQEKGPRKRKTPTKKK
jgi:cell division septation protein DedD